MYNVSTSVLQEETLEEKARKERLTERDQRFQYWGYRFEQYMTVQVDYVHSIVVQCTALNRLFCTVFGLQLYKLYITVR